jgi:MFS family permease
MAVGGVLLLAFVWWEMRAKSPMLPPHLFRSRGFTAANTASLLMYFGMFGSIFLLSQYFQIVLGLNPFEAGLRVLPWTAMPIFVAPIAGVLSGRIGARPIVVGGLVLMSAGLAWMAAVASPTTDYLLFVPPFIVSGVGMGMFFAPIANVVLSAVKPEEEGKASGANNAIREVGGVFGVAVLAAVFTAKGSYASPQLYVDGLVPAMWIGAAVVAVSAVAALWIPRHVRGEQPHGVVDGAESATSAAADTTAMA